MLLVQSQSWRTSDMSLLPLTAWFEHGVLADRAGWSVALSDGRSRLLEVYNSVLALILRFGSGGAFADEFEALAACRLTGGGWSDTTCENDLGLRNTCLAAGNLLRAGDALGRPDFALVGLEAVSLVIACQNADGIWSDSIYGAWETTAAALALLSDAANRVHATRAAVARAVAALVRTQGKDGFWPDPAAVDIPVVTAARLLAQLIRAASGRSRTACAAVTGLIASQNRDGSWGHGLIEETSAATEALLTFALGSGDSPGLVAAIDRGTSWLIDQAGDDGRWPEYPGGHLAVLPTCGALMCLARDAEYRRFRR
jgi:hypothetical protein